MRWSQVLNVVDVHCGGENARVVTGGIGDVPGETMFDKRAYLTEQRDDLRLRLLQEPRGGVIHSADFVLPSRHPEAQLGYVIAESTEYPVMSGSNTICVTTALLETGMLAMIEPVTHLVLESAGRPHPRGVHLRERQGHLRPVHEPARVRLPPRRHRRGARPRHVAVDVAWGGMAYVLVDAASLGFGLTPDEGRDLCVVGESSSRGGGAAAGRAPRAPGVPGDHELRVHRTARPYARRRADRPNAVVVSPGRLDRSPCGTGTSARLAVHARPRPRRPGRELRAHLDHRLALRQPHRVLTAVGGVPAVVPSVAGQAWITQLCQVGVDPTDPFPAGYTLADTWGAAPPSPLAARLVTASAEAAAR